MSVNASKLPLRHLLAIFYRYFRCVFAALRCPLPDVANMDVVVIPPSIAFGESFVYNCKAGKSKIA